MAKLADAADLKSAGPKGLWGFDSPSRHQSFITRGAMRSSPGFAVPRFCGSANASVIPLSGGHLRTWLFLLMSEGVIYVTGPSQICFFNPMRRVWAHLALAATCIGFLSPLIIAAQTSTIHACCLRSGKHHCHDSLSASGEPAFTAKHDQCPYSASPTLSSFQGVQGTQFNLHLPLVSGFLSPSAFEHGYRAGARKWSARGPPAVLL